MTYPENEGVKGLAQYFVRNQTELSVTVRTPARLCREDAKVDYVALSAIFYSIIDKATRVASTDLLREDRFFEP